MKQLPTRTLAIIALGAVAILAIGVFAVQNRTKTPAPVVENGEGQGDQGENEGKSNEYAFELQSDLDTSAWKIYRNEKYGFEFKIPPQGKVEEFYATEPPASLYYSAVFQVYENESDKAPSIYASVPSDDELKDFNSRIGSEMGVKFPDSYSYNAMTGAYVLYATAENDMYHIRLRIDDQVPEDVQFPEKYTPTFPQSDLFYEVLKSFRFTDE